MANRYYSSNAQPTTLAASLSSVSSETTGQTVEVWSITGMPTQYPFTLLLEWGTGSQEVVTVTQAATGTGPYTFANCTRGDDGTSAPAHTSGAAAVHGVSARDFTDAQTALAAAQSALAPTGSGAELTGITAAQVGAASTGALSSEASTRANADTALAAEFGSYMPLTGGTLTGPLVITDAPSPPSPSSLPVGPPGDSTANIGLQIVSSRPTDDITGGTDGTGRILLYSYQRAHTNLFGETIRNFLMHYDAKAMTAWYGPDGLYNGSGVPVGSTWHPWVWTGAHYEADSDAGLHCHWEVEVPDSTGAMQGRFEVPFGNTTTGAIGLDKTVINTNLADFHFYCAGTAAATSEYQEQFFRLTASAGYEKALEWNNDGTPAASAPRWRMVATSDAESGSNAGTNWSLSRFSDAGSLIDAPITITRQTGAIQLGTTTATGGVSVVNNTTSAALTIQQSGAASVAIKAYLADTSSQVIGAQVTGDSYNRFAAYSSGLLQWGSGSAARDTDLYRAGTALLQTDGKLSVLGGLAVSGGATGISGQYLCAPHSYAPGTQTQLTVSSTTLAAWSSGNACTNSFTAPASGSVLVTASFLLQPSASAASVMLALAATGTVTPAIGNTVTTQLPSSATLNGFTMAQFLVTGLTAGNSYQFDLLGAATSGDSATIYAFGQTSTTLGSKGAPVVMTVQGV
jgi:hypothetical protein